MSLQDEQIEELEFALRDARSQIEWLEIQHQKFAGNVHFTHEEMYESSKLTLERIDKALGEKVVQGTAK